MPIAGSTAVDESTAVPEPATAMATDESDPPWATGCATAEPGVQGLPGTVDQSQTGSIPETQAGISDIDLRVTMACTTVTIAFADQNGPISLVPSGIEAVSSQGQTRFMLPDSVALAPPLSAAPPARAIWEYGAAVPVGAQDGNYVLIVHGSYDPPIVTVESRPAQLVLEFPTLASPQVLTLDNAFVIDEIVESHPGRVDVSGWGAAFEGHAGIGLVDSNGRNVPAADGWAIEDHISGSTEFLSIRMGNPGVAWAPFSFSIVAQLPAGEYGMYLDACGGQCDPVPHESARFTLSGN